MDAKALSSSPVRRKSNFLIIMAACQQIFCHSSSSSSPSSVLKTLGNLVKLHMKLRKSLTGEIHKTATSKSYLAKVFDFRKIKLYLLRASFVNLIKGMLRFMSTFPSKEYHHVTLRSFTGIYSRDFFFPTTCWWFESRDFSACRR